KRVTMDKYNSDSTFETFDLYVLSSTKEEMDVKRDLGMHRENGDEEQKGKESLQTVFSAIQKKQSNFQQRKWSTTNDYSIKKSQKEKEKKFFISKSGEVFFMASQPNLLIDNYNGAKSLETSGSNQCLLEVKTGKNNPRCIWCINYSSQCKSEESIDCTPSSSGPEWICDSKFSKILGVRELRGDECLDLLMPVDNGSSYQVSNDIIKNGRNNGAMPKLSSLSELVDEIKKVHKFYEFHEPTNKWLIDQENKEYFSKTYGINNIHPLLVGCHGMVVLFLDDRGIVFAWCEMTHEMYIHGINKMEGLANFLYHPQKRCLIVEDTGELISDVELRRIAKEELEIAKQLRGNKKG
ncbi:3820_t:CDS:2, partial [Funneliformis geosporum]